MATDQNRDIRSDPLPWLLDGQTESMTMHELLALASKLHVERAIATQDDLNVLMNTIRHRAEQELEVGDGFKFETVRVERKLDGSVSIIFGF